MSDFCNSVTKSYLGLFSHDMHAYNWMVRIPGAVSARFLMRPSCCQVREYTVCLECYDHTAMWAKVARARSSGRGSESRWHHFEMWALEFVYRTLPMSSGRDAISHWCPETAESCQTYPLTVSANYERAGIWLKSQKDPISL